MQPRKRHRAIAAENKERDGISGKRVGDGHPAPAVEIHIQDSRIEPAAVHEGQCLFNGCGRTHDLASGLYEGVFDRHCHQHLVLNDKHPVAGQ